MRFTGVVGIAGIFSLGLIMCRCGNTAKDSRPGKDAKKVVEIDTGLHFSAGTERALDAFWKNLVHTQNFNGVVLSAFNDSIFAQAYGYANIEKKIPLRLDQPVQIASVSKTFCATVVMMLIEQKKILLTDSVNKYLKDFPYRGITIEQLLSHQSGLPEYLNLTDPWWKTPDKHISNDDIYKMLLETRPAATHPGTSHYYCNTNFVLLTRIIEKLTRMSYPKFLNKNIFKPLGMRNTRVADANDKLEKEEVQGHFGMGAVVPDHYQNGTYGDKNIISTVHDMYRFYKGLNSGALIRRSTLENMLSIRCRFVRGQSHYALGFRRRTEQGEEWAFHAGRWGGFRTNFYFSMNSNKCIVLLNNRMSGAVVRGSILTGLFSVNGAYAAWNSYLPKTQALSVGKDSLN